MAKILDSKDSLSGDVSLDMPDLEIEIDEDTLALAAAQGLSEGLRQRLKDDGHINTGTLDASLAEIDVEGGEATISPDPSRAGWLEREADIGTDYMDVSDEGVLEHVDEALEKHADSMIK